MKNENCLVDEDSTLIHPTELNCPAHDCHGEVTRWNSFPATVPSDATHCQTHFVILPHTLNTLPYGIGCTLGLAVRGIRDSVTRLGELGHCCDTQASRMPCIIPPHFSDPDHCALATRDGTKQKEQPGLARGIRSGLVIPKELRLPVGLQPTPLPPRAHRSRRKTMIQD